MSETKPETKNIYEKMTAVKVKIMGMKKSGNAVTEKYKYSYFELSDILQTLLPAMKEERLHMSTTFSATENAARLVVVNADNPEEQLNYETAVPDFPSSRMSPVQALGAVQTYMRRYLLMTAFDIAETDIIDGNPQEPEKERPDKKPAGKAPPGNNAAGKAPPIDEAAEELKRQIWAVIKDFPDELCASYKARCAKADRDGLQRIYDELQAALKADKELEYFKREVWETIKKLGKADLIESYKSRCKGADKKTLETILGEVEKLLKSQNEPGIW